MDSAAAVAAVCAADPAMAEFIGRAGAFEPRSGSGDYFAALARSIMFQQLAGRAAAAIHARLVTTLGGTVTPMAVLAATPESLRAAGLSANKAAAITDLARKATDGTVPLAELDQLSDDEIVERLSQVRGIGRWTAEMFLMFELRRLDVWPVDDYGVRNGWTLIHQLPALIKPKELASEGERFRPYRSIAAWYCWQAVAILRKPMVLPTA
ncbi:MAG: DNA-3-methyladenine glycosylase 2 family protein [Chloroflexi bacterium]|nr:DNA-3-methyladenine glycosylase 2 family protein [Chloroflexota bacterium]MBV9134953.1 DNA-3-methyladenine glycosylase 2 family protein [Chloroflexota bacterium]MBV9894970.1 DNA-3-methyladenine glycosylase 2 family protein [Chloroflexota bacterium]